MSKDPAVLFYTSDFLTGVSYMSYEERGQYITLLCEQHQAGHIPENHMISICGSNDSSVIKKFKQDKNGFYYNERMDIEKEKRANYCLSRSNNKSGRKKKNHTKINNKSYDLSYDNHMSLHMDNGNDNRNINISSNTSNNLDNLEKSNVCAKKQDIGIVETDKAKWKRSLKISIIGNDSEYTKRVDWWYDEAKKDTDWCNDMRNLYPGISFKKAFLGMKRWMLKDKKNRKRDINKTLRGFCKDKYNEFKEGEEEGLNINGSKQKLLERYGGLAL